jgi:predicted alpha/beta hydrolase
MTPPENYRVYAFMNFVGVPLTRMLGYAPGWAGVGEDLPRDVFLQWADWISHPRYLFDSKLPALQNFARYKGELRALAFSDDPWATRPAVEMLCAGFNGTTPEVLTVEPSDVAVGKIGHFGFFRPDHRDTLWRGAAEWIQGE